VEDLKEVTVPYGRRNPVWDRLGAATAAKVIDESVCVGTLDLPSNPLFINKQSLSTKPRPTLAKWPRLIVGLRK